MTYIQYRSFSPASLLVPFHQFSSRCFFEPQVTKLRFQCASKFISSAVKNRSIDHVKPFRLFSSCLRHGDEGRMVAVTRSQTKRKRQHEIRGESFPLPRGILVKVVEQLKEKEDHLSFDLLKAILYMSKPCL